MTNKQEEGREWEYQKGFIDALKQVNKILNEEIKNEESSMKRKAKRTWFYSNELRLLKKRVENINRELNVPRFKCSLN
jgi:hypothetical protein